jgi:hypothetical protein
MIWNLILMTGVPEVEADIELGFDIETGVEAKVMCDGDS